MEDRRRLFLDLCSELTGFSRFELEGTGLVEAHQKLLEGVLGEPMSERFYALAAAVLSSDAAADREQKIRETLLPPAPFWPVVSSLITLWYLGTWDGHTPSPLAYVEQLSYQAAHAHPPGAKPTGWGSWAKAPVS